MTKITISALIILLLFVFDTKLFSQDLKGFVFGINETNNESYPLVGANMFWMGTKQGAVTDQNGAFTLTKPGKKKLSLIVTYIGFENDTIIISRNQSSVKITLNEKSTELGEVEVSDKVGSSFFSQVDPKNVEIVTERELFKAACCNLAESFETNASIDVGFTDAISGARQIMMLGLAGKYSQTQIENIPNVRGLASIYGLMFVPGRWMESIQISKGASSIRNGYESITGLINAEYKKPDKSDPLFINFYTNHFGTLEANILSAVKLSKKWSTMVLYHSNHFNNKIDNNNDSFLDKPRSTQYNIMNRWKYKGKNIISQFGINYITEDKTGGHIHYNENLPREKKYKYGLNIKTDRILTFLKGGYVNPKKRHQSVALIASYNYHTQESFYGMKDYDATENYFNANLIYQSIFKNTNHKYTVGLSFTYDGFDETFTDKLSLDSFTFRREEVIPGMFLEYTYNYKDKLIAVLGVRDDLHNMHGYHFNENDSFGHLITPRIHVKWNITESITIKGSAGKGFRTPNIIAENAGYLTTSRVFIFDNEEAKIEEAWNYGIFLSKIFTLNERELIFNIDFYRTDFINQYIADVENPYFVRFYNLDGESYANSLQMQIGYELFKRFDIVLAYRYNDVRMTMDGELHEKSFVKKSKGLLNLSYATRFEKWQFDYTLQYNGKSRKPYPCGCDLSTFDLSTFEEYSPSFFIMNAQITKSFKNWAIYVGVENLTDFTQEDPILYAYDPYGPMFDASQVWGPVIGRKFYGGIRLSIKKIKANK